MKWKNQNRNFRDDLRNQLSPATTLQGVGFGRILSSIWKSKLALRLEGKQLKATLGQFEQQEEKPVPKEPPPEGFLPPKWYYSTRADLREGIRVLSDLHQDVAENGWLHAEERKPEIVRAFGEEYFFMLADWVPVNISAIQQSQMLADKAKMWGSSLPTFDPKNPRVVVDPKQNWEMGMKLINLTRYHLECLLRIDDLQGSSGERRTSPLDLANRYYTTATRELERSVIWYQYLKDHKL